MGQVYRNDKISLDQIECSDREKIVVSQDPHKAEEAGISCERSAFRRRIPILGGGLGHQSIGAAFTPKCARARFAGKTVAVSHDSQTIFRDVKNPFGAMRYHSLVIDPMSLPAELVVSAQTHDGVIMAVRHKSLAVEGVQFHPESILNEEGKKILKNFLDHY